MMFHLNSKYGINKLRSQIADDCSISSTSQVPLRLPLPPVPPADRAPEPIPELLNVLDMLDALDVNIKRGRGHMHTSHYSKHVYKYILSMQHRHTCTYLGGRITIPAINN